jgi:hypothetical protein
MPSSDTPESERLDLDYTFGDKGLQVAAQGPADWSRETPSDDQLSQQARQKIAEVLRELAERREP